MPKTTTGLDGLFGTIGTHYINELKRRATKLLVEATAPAGDPRTISILRRQSNNDGNTTLHIPNTWTTVAGMADLEAAVLEATDWSEQWPGKPPVELKDADRIILIADVPSGGYVLTSDRVLYDDPIYGVRTFDVVHAVYDDAANICRVLVKYAKAD